MSDLNGNYSRRNDPPSCDWCAEQARYRLHATKGAHRGVAFFACTSHVERAQQRLGYGHASPGARVPVEIESVFPF